MRQILRFATAGLTACGLMALALPAIAGTGGAADHCVTVKGNGSSASLGSAKVKGGTVCFTVSSTNPGTPGGGGGSNINMFQPNHGVSLAKALSDFKDEFSNDPVTAAKGTVELNSDVSFYGLAAVVPGHPETVTENLRAGTYYVWDLAQAASGGKLPVPVTLTVKEGGESHSLHGSVSVSAGGLTSLPLTGSPRRTRGHIRARTCSITWPIRSISWRSSRSRRDNGRADPGVLRLAFHVPAVVLRAHRAVGRQ